MPFTPTPVTAVKASPLWLALVCAAGLVGLSLLMDSICWTSATYDEVAYLRIGARWWRTGEQAEITRMGSPLTFWKLQQVPVLWVLDRVGRRDLIDDPIAHQQELLPLVRGGALWIWLASLVLCAFWSRRLYGPRAMALSAWLFVLSPNLIAHGGLATMELPLLAASTAMLFLFWSFLNTGRPVWFWASAAIGGVAFSCKFTTVLLPPILAVIWWFDGRRRGGREGLWRLTQQVTFGTAAYLTVLLLTDLAITGFAMLPLSQSAGDHPTVSASFGGVLAPLVTRLCETPIPQDWVGLATQAHHQISGGSSYLLGERRITGWSYYYVVALAVKVPLTFWLLLAARVALAWRDDRVGRPHDDCLPLLIGLFLVITSVGSARNYGLRYLLLLAPLAIIWISRLAESVPQNRTILTAWPAWMIGIGIMGQAVAVAAIHPFELTYFNLLAGGPEGGRYVLSDSNLDWGQGLKGLARLQRAEPSFRDLTFYYFGDTGPAFYGVEGRAYIVNAVDDQSQLPAVHTVTTRYLAVSASLQWGPWGPPGFFRQLNSIAPIRLTDDATIAIYKTGDVRDERNQLLK
jgi:hypothetical protein